MQINKLSKADCLKISVCIKSLKFMSVEKRSIVETMINDDFAERGSPYRVKVRPATILLYYKDREVLDFRDKHWKDYIRNLPDDVCEVNDNAETAEKEV